MTKVQPAQRTTPDPMPALVDSPKDRTDAGNAHLAPHTPEVGQLADHECVRGVWRIVYLTLGGLFFVLGMVGIVLPGLPTTPFLLLTSYFLARSWPRMHRNLTTNKLVGPILGQWQRHGIVELRVKKRAAALVGVAITLLICFSKMPSALLATVLAFAFVGLFVIYRLPSKAPDTTRTHLAEEQS